MIRNGKRLTSVKGRNSVPVSGPAGPVTSLGGIKIPVTKFEQYIVKTDDWVWYGILKRAHRHEKHTLSEWRVIVNTLKGLK